MGQNANSGEIKGVVTDSSGAVVPNVKVTITNIQTGVVTKTTSNGSGIYDVPSIQYGSYTISFSATGFREMVRKGITLQLGTIAVDAALQVGSDTQQIVVTSAVPLLQTEDSEQHITFDAKAVQNAPTVGGIWYNELTNVLPGVNGGGGQDASGQGVGVNGTQAYLGNWLMEGSDATQPRDSNASDNYPPIDAISEVNATTSNFGAQYGNGVATFNVSLKSGMNKWHGSAFEFIENDALNAKPWGSGGFATPLRWNEYGGSIGGPILKDKLFFYFTYQRNPSHSSTLSHVTVPTDAMRAGTFSSPIINPSTGQPYDSSNPDQIPAADIDKVAAAIQKYFPEPTDPNATFNNYTAVFTSPSVATWYVGKVDYNISNGNHLSASILEYPISLYYNVDALCSLGFDCTYGPGNRNQDAQITDTWTVNSKVVNEARIGVLRELDKYTPATYGKGYPAKIGLQPTYGANSPGDIFPDVTIDASSSFGQIGIGGGVHAVLADGSYMESDVLTLIHGKHTLKIGGQFDKMYQNYTNWGDVSSGNFVFSGVATSVPYADFLLGNVYGWYVYDYAETGARAWLLGTFVQDDYKVTPHLTLNLGLRYQRQSGWGESQNRWGTFDPTLVNTGQYVAPGTLGAITYGGQRGRNTIQDGVNEWAPRVGFSWWLKPHWTLRASYGIFDAPRSTETYTDGALGLGLNPRGSMGYGSSVAFKLQTGPPAGTVVYPSLSGLSNSQFNYTAVDYYPTRMPIQYYQEGMISLQHQFADGILLDSSYVFTKGTHLNFGRDINQTPADKLSLGYSGMPYTQYSSILGHLFDGYSNYNALQLRAEKTMNHGVTFIVNYALSKTMDTGTSSGHSEGVDLWQNAYDVQANYGLSELDSTHTLNGSMTYELPFGAGRSHPLHGLMDEAVGGWRVTGVFQLHSGIPFTPIVGTADNSNSQASVCGCGFRWLPNVVGNPHVSHPSVNRWFNPNAFATPASYTFGNAHRDMLRGPAWRDLDLSLGKTFLLREGLNLEVRADAFNALNIANYSQPSNGTGTTSTGVISTANGMRLIQLGGRFTF
ncbi:MAG: TonB-dependent receptor [Acidobacteriaceae bacterium]